MENIVLLDNNIDIDKKLDFQESRNRNEFTNVISKAIDCGTNYIIKSLPINEGLKDIAFDIKNAFKSKDFKEVLKVAVNSSIREGLEILNLPKNVISDITKISKIAFKGGLSQAISAGIDVITDKYLKNNIFSPVINRILKDVKTYVFSSNFKNKIDVGVNKLLDNTTKFNNLCEKWYEYYENLDIFNMNSVCRSIKKLQPHIVNDKDCLTQANIIDNMTQLINTKHSKLSPIQMQICSTI